MITLPKLTFSYNALEPFIDEETMRLHHLKHHQAYIDKLNVILAKYPGLEQKTIEKILSQLDTLPVDQKDKVGLRNQAGGYLNHAFFWTILGKNKNPDLKLITRLKKEFSSLDNFKERFNEVANNHFASGWAWLVEDENKKLQLYSAPNQDSPYLQNHTPLITLDLWEHAYYLRYQNRRLEYINNWWKVLKILH